MNVNATILTTPCPDLTVSEHYFLTLDFNIFKDEKQHFALAKDFIIELNTNPYARPGIKLIRSKSSITALIGNLTTVKIGNDQLLVSPEGCCIYFNELPLPSTENHLNTENTLLGNFQGVSIESANLAESLIFWLKIGFTQVGGSAESGWLMLKNEDNFDLNVMRFGMCPHFFSNPGLNFFNGTENPKIIQEIKRRNLPIRQEITFFKPGEPAENIIMSDQGGLCCFIFND